MLLRYSLRSPMRNMLKQILVISSAWNMDPVFKGYQSLPKPDLSTYANAFKTMIWSQNGTIAIPRFVEDYNKEDHAFHIVLKFPIVWNDRADLQMGLGKCCGWCNSEINQTGLLLQRIRCHTKRNSTCPMAY